MNIYNNMYQNKLILFFFFIFSLLIGLFFLFFERKILNIDSLYHPDAQHYLKLYSKYGKLSINLSLFENIINYFNYFFTSHLYYSIVKFFYEIHEVIYFSNPYRNIVSFNIVIFAITNTLILSKYLKTNEQNLNFIKIFGILIFCFLPYKIHLSVNVLKETIIFFILCIYFIYPSKITLFLSFILGTPLRGTFAMYYLLSLDFKKKFLKKNFLILILIILIISFFYFKNIYLSNIENIFEYLENRNFSNMGGREYDNVPNFSEYGLVGSLIRMLVWPFFLLSGSFVFFSDNLFMIVIAIEIILLQLILFFFKREYLFNFGFIIFLILVALYVNTYTSYIRYCYLALNLCFLKKMLNIQN